MITDDHYNELDKLLKKCVECEDMLTDWERDFISEWCDKLDTYGTSVRVTDKQQGVFDRIQHKLEKAGEL